MQCRLQCYKMLMKVKCNTIIHKYNIYIKKLQISANLKQTVQFYDALNIHPLSDVKALALCKIRIAPVH